LQVLDWIYQLAEKVAKDVRSEAMWKAEHVFTLVFGLRTLLCRQKYLCLQGYDEDPITDVKSLIARDLGQVRFGE
jgi:hypothetical protein